jgi:hypothetical protein
VVPTLDLENRSDWRTLGFDFEPGSEQWEARCLGRAHHPYNSCGDILANAAQLTLDCSEPYPGDIGTWGCLVSRLFVSKDHNQEGVYLIENFLQERTTLVKEDDLKKHNNALGMAYALLCAEHFGLPMLNVNTMPHLTMGLTLEDEVSLRLHQSQPYWLDDVTDGYIEN